VSYGKVFFPGARQKKQPVLLIKNSTIFCVLQCYMVYGMKNIKFTGLVQLLCSMMDNHRTKPT